MATPVILVDSATGSDTLCSGAGPGTAITGTKGRTRPTASELRVGFFEGSAPDLSGVAVDGTHVLWITIATAGARNFSSIAAKKDTEQTGTDGAITTGTAILTVGSTTSWTAGDVVKVVGAGAAAADLYSTVLTVDSATQATLNDNAGTTVGPSASWTNPKQVTLSTSQGLNTGATDTNWAIGGLRASIGSTNSRLLFANNSSSGDWMPGWICRMQSGHAESVSTVINLRRAGTAATGALTLEGVYGAATMPVITQTANAQNFTTHNPGQVLKYFKVQNTNGTKTNAFALQMSAGQVICRLEGMVFGDATNKIQGLWARTGGVVPFFRLIDCVIQHTNSNAFGSDFRQQLVMINCWIKSCAGGVLDTLGDAGANTGGAYFINCLFTDNTGDALTVNLAPAIVINCTFDANTGDGFDFSQNQGGAIVLGNIFSNNGGWGINSAAAGATNVYEDYNDFYLNTSGTINGWSVGPNDLAVNPGYTNTAGNDWSIGTALKAAGFPGTRTIANLSATRTYVDMGAAQRQESGLKTHPGMAGGMRG
jgi:hypothetical protein